MKQIIIVDDSQTSRMFIRRCLEIAGLNDAEFFEAVNGQEAFDFLQEQQNIDLLVTDLIMPEMDGETLLKKVKEDQRFSSLPVLVITSVGNPAKEEELLALGAFAILNKPVSPATILNKIGSLLKE